MKLLTNRSSYIEELALLLEDIYDPNFSLLSSDFRSTTALGIIQNDEKKLPAKQNSYKHWT